MFIIADLPFPLCSLFDVSTGGFELSIREKKGRLVGRPSGSTPYAVELK
jgi:hypothetical protein